jgi:hypothetical protein
MVFGSKCTRAATRHTIHIVSIVRSNRMNRSNVSTVQYCIGVPTTFQIVCSIEILWQRASLLKGSHHSIVECNCGSYTSLSSNGRMYKYKYCSATTRRLCKNAASLKSYCNQQHHCKVVASCHGDKQLSWLCSTPVPELYVTTSAD